ncbi:MAG: dihydroorotate dehydrogenase (quinone), partial [Pseudomonadota bacterium]
MERVGLRLLRAFEPETAHGLALKAMSLRDRAGLAPMTGPRTSPRLAGRLWGLDLPNPVGVAAGFDKNAEAVGAGLRGGAGFVEIGAVTPRPQQGNARPRLFRLSADRAAINRFGFNNQGMEAIAARLETARAAGAVGVVGVNLGANKETEDKAEDYAAVLTRFAASADFFTVNVSSPNTERLRDLQGREALEAVARRCLAARDA